MNTHPEAAREQTGTDSLKKRYEATPDFVTSEFPDPEVLLWTCLSIVEDYMKAGRPLPEHVRKAPFATLPWLNGMLVTPCLRDVLAKARDCSRLPLAVVIEVRTAFSSYKGGCEPVERLALKRANRLLIEHFYPKLPRCDSHVASAT